MHFTIVLLLVFVSVSATVFFTLSAMSRRTNPVMERLKQVNDPTGSEGKFLSTKEVERKTLNLKLQKILSELAIRVKTDDTKIRKKLIKAGYHYESGVRVFSGFKVFLAIALFVLYALLGLINNFGLKPLIIALSMAAVGYMVPNFVLNMKIKRRQATIDNSLPDALDFLVICVEAGLGLNSALFRVGKEMAMKSQEISDELLMVNQEIRTGASREQALHNLVERNESKYLRVLVSSLILSDRLGTNISDTLVTQSDSLRTQFQQRAEEDAAKTGIKMLFPLVMFILPTLFIIILGPAVILLIKEVLPILGK